eukprot:m.11750 g.11750  ORF g.11750 m.11750 type:complete len:759 (+) comp23586_c0_seq2:134-2410(+)
MELFLEIGLTEEKAVQTLKNAPLSKSLEQIILEAKKHSPCVDWSVGKVLYAIASRVKSPQRLAFLAEYVATKRLASGPQTDAAIDYMKSCPVDPIDAKDFELSCGVGVAISTEEVQQKVAVLIGEHKEELMAQRYRFNPGILMAASRKTDLKWADGKTVKAEMDKQVAALLGPKTEADLKQSKPKASPSNKSDECSAKEKPTEKVVGEAASFHKTGENYTTDGYVVTPKTMEMLKHHLNVTGGRVLTRFPPEPNGILHIGHAKAINFNFNYAESHGGLCYLRYDDTNPENEEERFFTGILDMVTWLGHKPWKITHSSDYFDELYDMAVELIQRGLAYVCHQQHEEIKGHNPPPSPWRNRPIKESLLLFEDMKKGKLDEGQATLRMKMIMEDGKLDPVAYRIKFVPHARTKDKWCIYPTYDYTHCLCDSLENITHSLCTKEFQSRRSAYYWLCNALDVYCPVQWEYGRLNFLYTVVSKRKIGKLIRAGVVNGWDDPRLFTLAALKRRGVPSTAVHKFTDKVGVTMAQTVLDPSMLDSCIRDELNATARRAMAVLDPLKITLINFPSEEPIVIDVFNIPPERGQEAGNDGKHSIPFDRVVFIDKSDFRETTDKNFRRLAPGQAVGLKHSGYVITLKEVIKDPSTGTAVELKVTGDRLESVSKPKAFIHWVSNPLSCEVRLYNRLFIHKNPAEVPGGILNDCNKDSLEVIEGALVDQSVQGAQVGDQFQFERVGYFSPDYESTEDKLVFNCTVSLKEDANK